MSVPDFYAFAACQQENPETFFPSIVGDNGRRAKQVCADCPVQTECLEYALINNIAYGYWGGLSWRQRVKLPRRRPCSGCGDLLPAGSLKTRRYCDHCRDNKRTTTREAIAS